MFSLRKQFVKSLIDWLFRRHSPALKNYAYWVGLLSLGIWGLDS